MSFRDLILYGVLIFYVLYITRINNMWGVSKGTKKAKEDVRLAKSNQAKKKKYLKVLSWLDWLGRNVGLPTSEHSIMNFKYRIGRLRWKIKILNRNIKPFELIGILRLIQLVGSFTMLVGIVMFNNLLFAILGVSLLATNIFNLYADSKIADEDDKLEREFPDLFLLLYSRLIQGTNSRLAPTLNDYIISLDAVRDTDSKDVIKNFVVDLRNNIEIYGDDSIAVTKLRDKYRSVMVINFCNLAVQALKGVDNSDKLLAFKLELSQKRTEQMKEMAEKRVARGSRAIWVVYAILFQFIFLSWLAKLTVAGGGLSSIF